MLGAQSFNNLLNANPFNHIFAPITPPPQSSSSQIPLADASNSSTSTTIIDLSSVAENDDDLEIVNVTAAATPNMHRKRHYAGENINENKRNRHVLYSDNQKNVPLKKRGVSNATNQQQLQQNDIAISEDSNQAQNLIKIDSVATCDSTSSSTSILEQLYQGSLEPKENINRSISVPSAANICNCLECFPTLGSNNSPRPKCLKLNKPRDEPSSSAASVKPIVEAKIDVSLLPGPSGLQQQQKQNTMPVKKRNNYYESDDDDYDSDEQNSILPLLSETSSDVKNVTTLAAPHLQLDWLSDEGTTEEEEEDDDVIFVSDRTEPIDLTADSDSENDTHGVNSNALPSSIDDEVNIDHELTDGDPTNESLWPLPIELDEELATQPLNNNYNHPGVTTTSNSSSQRTPIMSSVEIPPRQQQNNSPHVVISMNSRPRPINLRLPTRCIDFRNVITGNDVMLYDGSTSSSSTQQARPTVVAENTRGTTIVLSSSSVVTSQNDTQTATNEAHRPNQHNHQYHHHHHHHQNNQHNQFYHRNGTSCSNNNESTSNQGFNRTSADNSVSNNNVAHNHHHSMNYHHHRRHFYNRHDAPSPSNPLQTTDNANNVESNNTNQQQQQQNCRQHIGRCPFMTEGHHYNRPRRLPRDYYAINNGRPYAVHEDLWRRQYQEQEIRRQYWSSNFNEPEVQVLRPPPATSHGSLTNESPFVHRLVPLSNDGSSNPTSVPPNDILNRSFDRIARMNRYRRNQ